MFARFLELVLISVSIVYQVKGSYEILNHEIVPLLTKHKKTTICNLSKDNVDLGLGSTTKRLIKTINFKPICWCIGLVFLLKQKKKKTK